MCEQLCCRKIDFIKNELGRRQSRGRIHFSEERIASKCPPIGGFDYCSGQNI